MSVLDPTFTVARAKAKQLSATRINKDSRLQSSNLGIHSIPPSTLELHDSNQRLSRRHYHYVPRSDRRNSIHLESKLEEYRVLRFLRLPKVGSPRIDHPSPDIETIQHT